jgi:hypothetical protein
VSEAHENKAVILTPDRRLRVFVSSPLDELADERRAVARAISALRLTPVMFEQGARPHAPPDVYRAYLARSEVFIGLYWQQYGQAPPGADISGLEEEFDLSGSLPKLLYVKEPAPGRDPRLARLLDRIRQQGAVSYRTFSGPAELGQLVRDDLAALPGDRFATAGVSTRASAGKRRGPRPLPVSMPTTIPYYLGRPARVWLAAMLPGKSQPKTNDDSAAWACARQACAARSHPQD